MNKYQAYVYVTCWVKVTGIEAEDHKEAANQALREADSSLDFLFDKHCHAGSNSGNGWVETTGFAEEWRDVMVDQLNDSGDPDEDNSETFPISELN